MALGFYFDMTRCVGCRACQLACKDKNRVGIDIIPRKVASYETGSFPNVGIFNYSGSCNHCDNPECVAKCPTGAMYKAEDGTVQHDDELCIGCGMCAMVCPYGAPTIDTERMKSVKCDSCAYLRAQGKNPACVDACPTRALDFGDKDELVKKYGKDLVSELPILPKPVTGPNVLIKAKENALTEDFRELPN